jgi:hypothetical protein
VFGPLTLTCGVGLCVCACDGILLPLYCVVCVWVQARLVAAFWSHAGEALRDGRLRPVIDRVYAMADAAAAHRYVEANSNTGKVILTWEPGTPQP